MATKEIIFIIGVFILIYVGLTIKNRLDALSRIRKFWGRYPSYEFKDPYEEKYLRESFEIIKENFPD